MSRVPFRVLLKVTETSPTVGDKTWGRLREITALDSTKITARRRSRVLQLNRLDCPASRKICRRALCSCLDHFPERFGVLPTLNVHSKFGVLFSGHHMWVVRGTVDVGN